MTCLAKYSQTAFSQGFCGWVITTGEVQAEPLARDRVLVLTSGITDCSRGNAGGASQPSRQIIGVFAAFFDQQPKVFTFAFGLGQRDFLDQEVVLLATDDGADRGGGTQYGKASDCS